MNAPVDCNWTDEDVYKEYGNYQDKKKTAKIFCITVKEVSEILNRKKD